MFEYADIYMRTKPKGIKYVILNVDGGEALHHPDIVEILSVLRKQYEPYQDHWHLTVTTTTNAIIAPARLDRIIPFIDEFTVSYHTENTTKQKQQFQNNLLKIKSAGARQKCIVLMHSESHKFADAQAMISWLTLNDIKYLPNWPAPPIPATYGAQTQAASTTKRPYTLTPKTSHTMESI